MIFGLILRWKLVVKPRNPIREARIRKAEELWKALGETTNIGEFLMKSWLDLLVDDKDYEDNARPDFLKNPLTEQNLEYDRYYRRGVAFEFNGPQHYGPTERYPNKRGARERRARDLVKKALSIENGVQLVIVHSQDLTPANMVAKIGNLLPLREFDPNDPYGTALHKASRAYIRRVAGRSI